jgi:hypothetical protein
MFIKQTMTNHECTSGYGWKNVKRSALFISDLSTLLIRGFALTFGEWFSSGSNNQSSYLYTRMTQDCDKT